MISDTIFVIQNSPFVKWMTHNTLFYGSYGDGWIIATYGHCTSWMLYKYTIEQFYSFREKMHCIKLYYIYFKSMCSSKSQFLWWMLQPLFCLEVTAAKETFHHFHYLQDHFDGLLLLLWEYVLHRDNMECTNKHCPKEWIECLLIFILVNVTMKYATL